MIVSIFPSYDTINTYKRYVGIMCARGHLKTTFTLTYCAYMMSKYPNYRALYVSATLDQAIDKLEQFEELCKRSWRLSSFIKGKEDGGSWKKSEKHFSNGSRIRAASTSKSLEGPHVHLIILDDILDPDCNLFHMVAMVLYASSEITEHIDDNLIHTYGDDIIKHPKCTTVYYANVPDSMIGGELISENLTITPVTNSLITIPGNVPHRVTEITQATEPRITLIIEQYKVIKYNLQKYDTSNVTIIEG